MTGLQDLIAEIEVNEAAIAELEVKAEPATAEQQKYSQAAKAARAAGRVCQKEIDSFLAPAQVLRYANQQLKLKAGQVALNDAKST